MMGERWVAQESARPPTLSRRLRCCWPAFPQAIAERRGAAVQPRLTISHDSGPYVWASGFCVSSGSPVLILSS